MNKMTACPRTGLDEFEDMHGQKRLLASIASNGKMKAIMPRFKDVAQSVPKSDWKPIDRRPIFGSADWIFNQGQIGECVGCGGAGALRRARRLTGNDDVKLSSGALYAQINGGSDNGAVVSDAMTALMFTGTLPFSVIGVSPFYLNQMPSGWQTQAANYKILKAGHCETWEDVMSGLMLGGIPFYGYQVGNNFESFDKYGVAGHAKGPGNHCNHADGVVLLPDGRYVLDDVNSWDFSWGPFSNGRVYIDEQHLFGGGDQPDCCIIWAALSEVIATNVTPAG